MIYISGKITGTDDYLQRFEVAENHLNNMDILDITLYPKTRLALWVKTVQLPSISSTTLSR